MFPPKKQQLFDDGGVEHGITPGVSPPLTVPNHAGPTNVGMTTGGGYQAPQNAVSPPLQGVPSVNPPINPPVQNTPGREYYDPTAQERASFIQNNPGDEGRMREAFSRTIGGGGNVTSSPPPTFNDIIPSGAPPPISNIPQYANPSVVPQGINPGGGDTTNTPGPPGISTGAMSSSFNDPNAHMQYSGLEQYFDPAMGRMMSRHTNDQYGQSALQNLLQMNEAQSQMTGPGGVPRNQLMGNTRGTFGDQFMETHYGLGRGGRPMGANQYV